MALTAYTSCSTRCVLNANIDPASIAGSAKCTATRPSTEPMMMAWSSVQHTTVGAKSKCGFSTRKILSGMLRSSTTKLFLSAVGVHRTTASGCTDDIDLIRSGIVCSNTGACARQSQNRTLRSHPPVTRHCSVGSKNTLRIGASCAAT
eukprot:Amastigsp_a762_29.p4 type:complete len:148 gc:universal Amastigsp_a762_29:790-1233(+)